MAVEATFSENLKAVLSAVVKFQFHTIALFPLLILAPAVAAITSDKATDEPAPPTSPEQVIFPDESVVNFPPLDRLLQSKPVIVILPDEPLVKTILVVLAVFPNVIVLELLPVPRLTFPVVPESNVKAPVVVVLIVKAPLSTILLEVKVSVPITVPLTNEPTVVKDDKVVTSVATSVLVPVGKV